MTPARPDRSQDLVVLRRRARWHRDLHVDHEQWFKGASSHDERARTRALRMRRGGRRCCSFGAQDVTQLHPSKRGLLLKASHATASGATRRARPVRELARGAVASLLPA